MRNISRTSNEAGGSASGAFSSNEMWGPVGAGREGTAFPFGIVVAAVGRAGTGGGSNSINSASASGLRSVNNMIPPPPAYFSAEGALLPPFAPGMEAEFLGVDETGRTG